MLYKSVASILSLFALGAEARVSYDNHLVLRCNPENRKQLDQLHALEEKNDYGLDFWQETRRVGVPVDIMVSKHHQTELENILDSFGVKCSVMMKDVEAAIANEAKNLKGIESSSYFDSYHNWTEVQSYIEGLVCF